MPGPSPVLQVRLDPEVLAWLDDLGADWGVTRSVVARVAIKQVYLTTLKEGTPP